MPRSNLLFWTALGGTFCMWLLSYIAFVHPAIHVVLVAGLLVLYSILAYRHFSIALLVLCVEVIIGNKGSLLSVPIGGTTIGIRIVLFALLGIAWLLLARNREVQKRITAIPFYKQWALFLLVLLAASIYGFLRTRSGLVYFDANGYVMYLLLIPLS